MTRIKTSADRFDYVNRKMSEYGERLRSDRNYDRHYTRRSRLISYKNRAFKQFNREQIRKFRKTRKGTR